jgi:hypothetical protein
MYYRIDWLIGLQQESSSEGEIKDSPEKGDQSFADPGTRKKGQKIRSTCPPYRRQCFGSGFIVLDPDHDPAF